MATEETQSRGSAIPVMAVIEVVSAIAGSGVLLSGLMLYFGWVRTRVLFDHFGVPVELLEFSTADYILRSADVFFRPVVWSTFVLAGLGAVAVAASFVERQPSKRREALAIRVLLATATVVCAGAGLRGFVVVNPEWPVALMCIGGALIVMQYALYRNAASYRLPPIVLVVGVLLTIVALFWRVAISAAATGAATARDVQDGLTSRPTATVYSKADLGILGGMPSADETSASGPAWPFVYSGYSVLAYANDRWFLIRQPWQPGTPTVILLDSDAVRVEVSSP